ncbi:DUF3263 domain-containing protein [Gulosibacter molinativorax]|uniref:DUF3263 domain-containing protein n=1 Tax=Gulosibacter molinativorax TaxID=256821 RepID=A0ABT7CB74_9MICO|nr:DUF3263 domain-containing protein [Gulosibacter molinativorax]MDJ1372059.1 DUF3263 domain-containing protein [Gulosibacter molinativorax]QUY63892.1 Hypotetical protein [Gulosibacter molinativorax]
MSLSPSPIGESSLSELERRILDFEDAHPQHSRAKEDSIRADFGYSSTRYYQILGTLMESPDALRENPLLIKRLHRIRDRKRARRYRSA